MNKIIIKFLLTGDKFMSELHLKQPGNVHHSKKEFEKLEK